MHGVMFCFSTACSQVATKLQELSTAVQASCQRSTATPSSICSCPVGWTSVTMTQIGSSSFQSAHTVSYLIPSVIPNTANEVFVYGEFQSGRSSPDRTSHFKIYTENNGRRYEQYILLHSFRQSAWNSNSDNLWFPMPRNRRIYMHIPNVHSGNIWGTLYAIGYR